MHSDLTKSEFEATMLGLQLPAEFVMEDYVAPEEPAAPKTLRQSTFQTRIRNQGACGSCWAFSAIAVTEKFYYDQNRVQVDFSTQDLVNCVSACNGCGGGWPTKAMAHVATAGIAQATTLPYVAVRGVCATDIKRLKMGTKWSAKQSSWSPATSTKASAAGVWGGIVVAASQKFKALSKTDDVYDASLSGECNNAINHAVTAIGSPATGVVSVMNSWGTSWGVNCIKKIKACSSSLIWGSPSPFMHPYANFN